MKIKRKTLDENYKLVIIDDELNVGDGVTLNYYSNEKPATVIEIGPNGRWIKVQEDTKKRIDNNGMSGCQDYEYSRNPNGRIHTFYKTRRKDITLFTDTGRSKYNQYDIYLSLKFRKAYFDYSFLKKLTLNLQKRIREVLEND